MRVPVSGRKDGCDTDIEHKIKSANATNNVGRAKATVSGKSWLKEEDNCHDTELITEGNSNGRTTCLTKISPLLERSRVGPIKPLKST
jgi:hypothetical protein